MTRVIDLRPGDLTIGDNNRTAVYIAQTVHPIWPNLQLVIWRLDNGTITLDALSPAQDVGTVAPSTGEGRSKGLREALLGGAR